MRANTLTRLDADPGGARDFLAAQIVSGANNADIAAAFARKFDESITERSISKWKNNEDALLRKVAALEASDTDKTAAKLAVQVELEKRLKQAEKLSVDELLKIHRALNHNAARASGDDTSEDGIDRAVWDCYLFSLTADYGEEGYAFADVLAREGATDEEITAAIPKDADLDAVWAAAVDAFGTP